MSLPSPDGYPSMLLNDEMRQDPSTITYVIEDVPMMLYNIRMLLIIVHSLSKMI